MKPLATAQSMLKWFCVWQFAEPTSKWMKVANIIFTFSILLANVIGLLASVAFFLKFVSIDLETSLYGFFSVFGFAEAVYCVLFIIFSRHQIADVITKLAKIYEASKKRFSIMN